MRSADRASREDGFAAGMGGLCDAVMLEFDALHLSVFDDQLAHMRLSENAQVGPLHRRAQKGFRCVPADAGTLVDVEIAGAFVIAAVEIVDGGDAGFFGGLLEGVEHGPADAGLFHSPFAARVVHGIGTLVEILALLEERQHVIPAPAGTAHLPPEIVVTRLAAHVDHAVDRRAAAEQFSAWIAERAAVQAIFLFGGETPVGARVVDAIKVTNRDMDPVVIVVAAGLKQKHAIAAVFRKAVGEHAAGAACTDDDVIVGFHVARRSAPVLETEFPSQP
ncbi:hypothetical protein D3C71_1035100 [compost metagenome]